MTVTEIIRRRRRRASVAARPTTPPRPRSQAIVTRAEQAECTCPEHCERDHERD
ncbi:MAG: hypothetical protein U0R50_01765 [Gaiellales bacterium]